MVWGLVACTAFIAVVGVVAVVMRRWVALILALLLALGSSYLAGGVYGPVSAYINPPAVVQDEPIHCQCYSGGSCDCPGGRTGSREAPTRLQDGPREALSILGGCHTEDAFERPVQGLGVAESGSLGDCADAVIRQLEQAACCIQSHPLDVPRRA